MKLSCHKCILQFTALLLFTIAPTAFAATQEAPPDQATAVRWLQETLKEANYTVNVSSSHVTNIKVDAQSIRFTDPKKVDRVILLGEISSTEYRDCAPLCAWVRWYDGSVNDHVAFYWQGGFSSHAAAQKFKAALDYLAPLAHQAELDMQAKAEVEFERRAADWRAMPVKPPLSDEVTKKRLLAEDAVAQKNVDAAFRYYAEGVTLDPTWAQGWFNAALLRAEQKQYARAANDMKHYLILMPDAPDAAEAKQKQLLWEAKAEELGEK